MPVIRPALVLAALLAIPSAATAGPALRGLAGSPVLAPISAQCGGACAEGAGLHLASHKKSRGLRGYRPAWTDDRLNPHRGPRTQLGEAEMYRYFEPGTVPMRARTTPPPTTGPAARKSGAAR